jgi:hypothetical protein
MGGIFKRKSSRPASPAASKQATAAPKQTESDAGAELDTTSTMLGKKKTGKKALVTQPAAANVGGTGQSGLNIPKG